MERRNYQRINFKGFADLYDVFNNYISRAEICNISENGICVLTTHSIRIGVIVVLNLLKEEMGKDMILVKNISGKILRTQKILDKMWFLSLMFSQLNCEKKSLRNLCLNGGLTEFG